MGDRLENAKYALVCRALRDEIKQGIFSAGEKIPSEKDLSERYACSRHTVRQALNILEHENLIVRRRGSGTYVSGASVRERKLQRIGVITTYITDYIFPFIIRGIEETAARNGYHLVFGATKNRVENEKRLLHTFLSEGVDGLIVEGTKSALPNPNLDLYREAEKRGIPVVFLNGSYRELKNSICVRTDDRRCGAEAVEYLYRCGCTRLGGIFKTDDMQGHERYAGYMQAVLKNGGEFRDDTVFWYTTGDADKLFSAGNAETLLCALRECDGVVCYNDQIAYELIVFLQTHGISVPDQISVIGVDNAGISSYSSIKITTFAHPKEKLGVAAAEKLFRMIQDGRREKSEVFSMPLLEKDSVKQNKSE